MTYLDSSAQLMRISRKVDQTMTWWVSFNKIVIWTSGVIYEYVVSYAIVTRNNGARYEAGARILQQQIVVCMMK